MRKICQNHHFIKKLTLSLFFFMMAMHTYADRELNRTMPDITGFNKSDYGAANKNWSVTFDDNGFVYFGNDIGLLEFDGVSWDFYPSHNGFIIRCVEYFNNRIYSGGYRELGYWERDTNGNLFYQSLTSQVEAHLSKNEEFWDISVLNGKVYFRSFTNVYIYTPGEGFVVVNAYGFISHSNIVDNEYWLAISNKGIFKIGEDQVFPILESDFFREKSVTLIEKTEEEGVYLIATESQGMFKYFYDSGAIEPWIPDLTDFFVRNKIDKTLLSPEGNIILGTIMNGVMILDKEGRVMHHINVDSGLQSNTVHALATDHSGNIWMLSDKGIDFISFSSSQSYIVFDHEEIGAVYSAALFGEFLYMGTNQGLFRRSWQNQNQLFTLLPGTQRQVWDCTIIDDNLFVGHNSGTFIIDKNHQIRRLSTHAGASSVTRAPGNPDYLIQSTYNNLVLYQNENGRWDVSTPIAGFDDLIQSVEFDHRGNLWASHPYRGIYRIRLNDQMDSVENITYYGKNSHLWQDGNSLRAFKVDNRIVLTNGKRMYTYDDLNDSVIEYDYLNEFLGDYASSFLIIPGISNHYWFLNKKGIALFNIHGGDIEKIKEFPGSLFEKNLIPRRENLIPINDKTAILCLENGYAILDATARDEGKRITTEKLTLRKVSSGTDAGTTILLSTDHEKFTIPFAQNNLSVVYSFPLYSGEEINYQYILEGLTEEWSEPLEKPSFTINRIPPGNYHLKVRAVNNWQRTSPVHEILVTVKPPFYQSGIALITYALFFIILFLIVRYMIRRKVKMQERHKWEEREQERMRERNKQLQSDLSFKSRQLATSALSMAKKNESLMEIKKKLSRQKEELGSRYPEKCFNEIVKKIDEGITGDAEWKIFEHNFNQAHETFLHNLKDKYPGLTPNDLRLCAFLRINLASKEIAPLLGISVRGVENHRYRLRKKLNLSADDDLTEFLFTFQGDKNPENNAN